MPRRALLGCCAAAPPLPPRSAPAAANTALLQHCCRRAAVPQLQTRRGSCAPSQLSCRRCGRGAVLHDRRRSLALGHRAAAQTASQVPRCWAVRTRAPRYCSIRTSRAALLCGAPRCCSGRISGAALLRSTRPGTALLLEPHLRCCAAVRSVLGPPCCCSSAPQVLRCCALRTRAPRGCSIRISGAALLCGSHRPGAGACLRSLSFL